MLPTLLPLVVSVMMVIDSGKGHQVVLTYWSLQWFGAPERP